MLDQKWHDRKWPEVTWPEETLCESMFCACVTRSCAISALVGPFSPEVTKSRDQKRPCPALLLFPVFFPEFFSRNFSLLIFPYLFFSFFFPRIYFSCNFFQYFFLSYYFFPYYFPVLFFPYFFLPYFFLPYFFSVLFSRTFSKVATFEIRRFKISVSCFSSSCRYNTVHVPCGISIQTSPVGLPLDGWGARMRDLNGPKMNLFNLKEDWNVLLHQPIISLEIEPMRSRYFRPFSQSDCKNWFYFHYSHPVTLLFSTD